jgi:hypothetical protein
VLLCAIIYYCVYIHCISVNTGIVSGVVFLFWCEKQVTTCFYIYIIRSQIKAEIKAMQTMAVICSMLKYFTYVIVGVAKTDDEALIKSEVSIGLIHDSFHDELFMI